MTGPESGSVAPVRLALTLGDPAGIGPQIVGHALADPDLRRQAQLLVVGDSHVLDACRERWFPHDLEQTCLERLNVATSPELAAEAMAAAGPTALGGRMAAAAVDRACDLALSGAVDAVVTAPLCKEALSLAGNPFPGHTEMLAARAGGVPVAMAFFAGAQRVALVTTHLALRDVSAALNVERVVAVGCLLDRSLRRWGGVRSPRLGVSALNPHAGEGGLFGDEEQRILAPAVVALREVGVDASGPHAADTLFLRAAEGEFDGVVALYHDQALIPVKLMGRGGAVNVTLGLPFVRTSPDHGTAYDIVGSDEVDAEPFLIAARKAVDLAASPMTASAATS